jgi:predicted ribosome quality control (RQC) complex YloA/Tae2 family protein
LENQRRRYLRIVGKNLEKLQTKAFELRSRLDEGAQAEEYRVRGELITANIYRLKKGMRQLEAVDYFKPDAPVIAIPLDPELTPAANAQRAFKQYHKARRGAQVAEKQWEETQRETDFWQGIKEGLEESGSADELESMSRSAGLAPPSGKKSPRQEILSQPFYFRSSQGFDIMVGRSGWQNDLVTFRLARDHDLWCHVKDHGGSHVVIRTEGREVPDKTLEEACRLAAYFSQARMGNKVPVDYTRCKYVFKQKGGGPGKVNYINYQTLYVDPDPHLVERLRIQ